MVTDDRSAASPWYLPTIADMIFVAVMFRAMVLGQSELLNDPGTFWHIRVGELVLESGPPHVDTFSYTRAGEKWISQHWLCDAGAALLYRAWGWNGLVAASAILLGLTYRMLFRTVLDSGANVGWAAALTLLAAGCGAPHWLARPHLFSLLFMVLTIRWCVAFHRSGSRRIWMFPVVAMIWANVHGAFLAGLVVVACSMVGQFLSVPRDRAWRNRLIGFSAVFLIACVATLVNPYGWHLHAHLGELLFSSGVRDLIDEWRAPDFQNPETRPWEAMLLLTLGLFAFARQRGGMFELLHIAAWVHFGLVSVRQVSFASLVIAPLLGTWTVSLGQAVEQQWQLGGRITQWLRRVGDSAREWAEAERGVRWPLWSGLLACALAVATALHLRLPVANVGSAGLSPARWPIVAVERLNEDAAGGTLFNDLNWGGYVILMSSPTRPVFADDRFELYGRAFLLEYLDALEFGSSWQQLVARHDFEHVLISPRTPLSRFLRTAPDWRVSYEDDTAILFRRLQSSALAAD